MTGDRRRRTWTGHLRRRTWSGHWRRRALTAVGLGVTVLATASTVAANGDHGHEAGPGWGPIGLFLLGVVLIVGSVALDARDAVADGPADAGVVLGLLAVLASVGLAVL